MFFSNKDRTKVQDRAGAGKRELKKTHTGEILKHKAVIEDNANAAAVLVTLAEGKPCCADLKSIEKDIRYSNPSSDPDVAQKDKKIGEKLADIKIKLASERDRNEDVAMLVKELKLLLAERAALA